MHRTERTTARDALPRNGIDAHMTRLTAIDGDGFGVMSGPRVLPAPVSMPRRCWARLAQVGFWFFLIKGLLWLTVPLGAAWLGYGP